MPAQRKGKRNQKNKPSKNEKGKKRQKVDINDVYEASDDERQVNRKGHAMDEVEDYQYHVETINEEDDEEIDSDEAFDESDHERFESFKFSGSTKDKDKTPKRKTVEKEISLNESFDEDEDDEGEDGEGYMDLSEMLDDDNGSATTDYKKALGELMCGQESDSEASLDGFGTDSEEEEEEDGGGNQEKDEALVNFIDSLETRKRKLDEDDAAKKRQKHEELSEAYTENEFNLLARSTASARKKKLDLDDLMGSISNEAAFTSLRKTVEELDGKGKNVVKSALDAPLAKRLQDRLDRQAAYKEANKEISRWQETVKHNREAEHLSFPMQAPDIQNHVTSASLTNKFKAENNLEKQIEEALQAAGMKEEELEAFEALKLNKLSIEEVEKRRRELRLMRELMFRHQVKAKRMKKIKSKAFRKLLRKERAKKEQALAGLGAEVDQEMDPDEVMKAAAARAEERMTLKHKNTSRWAKRILARGHVDEGTREALMEQLRRGDELRRKIQGVGSGDSDSDDDGPNDREQVTDELEKLERELDEESSEAQPKKGLFAMKFMQEAEKRQREETKAMIDEFKNEWLAADDSDDEKNEGRGEDTQTNYALVGNNPGRLAFGVNANKESKPVAASKPQTSKSDLPASTDKSTKTEEKKKKFVVTQAGQPKASEDEQSKPSGSALNAGREEVVTTNDSEGLQQIETRIREDVSTMGMVHSSRVTFSQRDLVARAFANDNVVQEFDAEKEQIMQEDADKTEDLTLPGWGSWAGKGIKKKKNKVTRTIKGVDPSRRKDAKLSKVIINEKRIKKIEKYEIIQVPFPFQNMEQYERSIRAPMGKEWNTRDVFQKLTKPRVLTKLGTVIDPLKAPFRPS